MQDSTKSRICQLIKQIGIPFRQNSAFFQAASSIKFTEAAISGYYGIRRIEAYQTTSESINWGKICQYESLMDTPSVFGSHVCVYEVIDLMKTAN